MGGAQKGQEGHQAVSEERDVPHLVVVCYCVLLYTL
jgi:hypothetical protein